MYNACIAPFPLNDSALTSSMLGQAAQWFVGSPSLLDPYGMPNAPEDLASWPSLGYGPPVEDHVWNLLSPDGSQVAQPLG